MEYLQALTVPCIAAAVYAVIALIKYTLGDVTKFKRFIPLTAMALGIVIAVVCFYAFPDMVTAKSVLAAAVHGAASGLTATGFDQILKQMNPKDE